MAHPVMFTDDDPGLAELRAIALDLPGAEEKVSPGNHRQVPSALIFTPDPVDLPSLEEDSRLFVPAYYGPYGARAIDLADPEVDWDEIAELVDASYRMIAPKRLVELDARP